MSCLGRQLILMHLGQGCPRALNAMGGSCVGSSEKALCDVWPGDGNENETRGTTQRTYWYVGTIENITSQGDRMLRGEGGNRVWATCTLQCESRAAWNLSYYAAMGPCAQKPRHGVMLTTKRDVHHPHRNGTQEKEL